MAPFALPVPVAPLALTIPEVVTASRMSRSSVYEALKNRALIAKKSGRRTIVLQSDLERFLAELPEYRTAA